MMNKRTRAKRTVFQLVCMLVMLAAAPLAQAHILPGQMVGLAHGLAHPFTGMDHLAAMVAVGFWATQCGGRAIWLVPLSFVTAMSIGGAIGMSGMTVPFIESGIAASVLVLGLLIAAAVRLPLAASSILVGSFALCHGIAHGAEMPVNASGLAFGVGFVLSTIVLHGWGIALGLLARTWGSPRFVQYAGAGAAAFGLYLFIV
ncbi:MAG TPA: HupE/UreJ family protein [Dyella sp.]|uniref:HupE/UreJ family protein n=1 Tax=Dyella sp. TaxID=1869338 RepID=UPI002C0CC08C|nr:HupE/UreJ family protein [Dyella sp.]HUB88989.1 HupE/UreJ family protein [Dyella sp.]